MQAELLLPAPVVAEVIPQDQLVMHPAHEDTRLDGGSSQLPPPMPTVNGLVCPLCHEMLEDPVMTVDGHTYCRRCIQDWFVQQTQAGGKPKSPATGQPLLSLLLFPNLALGKAMVSIRTNMQPAWIQAEKERQALRMELEAKSRELMQARAHTTSKDSTRDPWHGVEASELDCQAEHC
ncbi:unnamed protein product [Durusdinium trenchii]|uniref:U-box domain-containing protein n=1 Tax=Durusdinium trenchii TaxID=1381693 RepID=A0ABP0I9H9_9DINO